MERRRLKAGVQKTIDSFQLGAVSTGKQESTFRRWLKKKFPLLGILLALASLYRSFTIHVERPSDEAVGLRGACSGYKGILLVSRGDTEGAAGTIFFLFVLNQLLYAEEYNLIPWIHLNNASHHVYDKLVHGNATEQHITVGGLMEPSWLRFFDPIMNMTFSYPGKPRVEFDSSVNLIVEGNGVWNSYFEPASRYNPKDASCQILPLVRLSHSQIIPGLHLHTPYSLKAWRYGGMSSVLRKDEESYSDWFRPIRRRGSLAAKRYVRFLPYLHDLAKDANPHSQCMAVHIRHSDKANRRKRIPLKQFLPYIDAYLELVPEGNIFVATDSSLVIEQFQTKPRVIFQHNTLRSSNTTAVFRLHSHHKTNVQVLVDILAMSKCQVFLHGLSAVSEAALYLSSWPRVLSINLEVGERVKLEDFRKILAGLPDLYENGTIQEHQPVQEHSPIT